MNCRKVSRLLSAYMDGELPGVEHRQIHEHLAWCEECSEEHARLLQMKRLLAGMRVQTPRPELSGLIVQRLAGEDAQTTLTRSTSWLHRFGQWIAPVNPTQQVATFGAGFAVVGLLLINHLLAPSQQTPQIQWMASDTSHEVPLSSSPMANNDSSPPPQILDLPGLSGQTVASQEPSYPYRRGIWMTPMPSPPPFLYRSPQPPYVMRRWGPIH